MTRPRSFLVANAFLVTGAFLAISLLAACATSTPPWNADNQPDGIRPPDAVLPGDRDTIGRIGPDGGPLLVDRGIGGTGAPNALALEAPNALAPEAPNAAALQMAERGIGGTGIIGVVTGFGSVFVDGIEIRYYDTAPVDIDGVASSVAALRVGQLVAIQADGPADSPYARAISVRSAVSGRIEALELGSGMLTIGGQPVLVPDGTWGANRFGLGDWVKVSGLRRADGTIEASRLDLAPVGTLTARGRVVREGGVVRVGNLVLPGSMAAAVKDGQFVVVSGDYAAGHGHVVTIAPDTLLPNLGDYFGTSVSRLIVQAFVQIDKDSVSMNGMKVNARPVVSGQARHNGIAVVSMERGADGSYAAVELHYAGFHGQTDRPLHRAAGIKTSDASPMLLRNGRANVALSSQPEAANNGSTAGGHLTASSPSDLDPSTGSPGSEVSPVETPSAIVSDPIVTAAMPNPSMLPGAKDAGSNLKTTPVTTGQPPVPISAVTTPVGTPSPPAVVSDSSSDGSSITHIISPPDPIVVSQPVASPTGTAKPQVVSGQVGSGSGQLISGSTAGTGTGRSAAQTEHGRGSLHMRESPRAVRLKGATWASTANEITTAVTTVTTTTTGGRAGGTSTAETSLPATISQPDTTNGATSGRSLGGSADKRQGH